MRVRLAVSGWLAAALSCADPYGSEGQPAPSDAGDPDASTSPMVDGGGADASGGVEAGADATCSLNSETVTVEADTLLLSPGCDGANHYGADPWVNMLADSRTLLRFVVSAGAITALVERRVASMHIVLTRAMQCGATPCPAATAGMLQELPFRTDWDEGAAGSYLGADYCRRLRLPNGTRVGWGPGSPAPGPGTAVGPSDWGAAGRTSPVAPNDPTVSIDVDPAGFDSGNVDVAGRKLAVMLVPAPGRLAFVTREGAAGAKLTLSWCTR